MDYSNKKFTLISAEVKTVGETYFPPLRTITANYTQALNGDYISTLALTNNYKALNKVSSYLTGLSPAPISELNKPDTHTPSLKTLLKLIFKTVTSTDVESYLVIIGYCQDKVELTNITDTDKFVPTYSFEYAVDKHGKTHFFNKIDFISMNKEKTSNDMSIYRPGDIIESIKVLSLDKQDTFLFSQCSPLSNRNTAFVNRENINPFSYIGKIFNLASYPIEHHYTESDVSDSIILGGRTNIYTSLLNFSEPLVHANKFPFDILSLNFDRDSFYISLKEIIELYPDFFDVVKIIETPLIDYTKVTNPFGNNTLAESISQELVLNILEAISDVGLEDIHIKGSNIDDDKISIATFTFIKANGPYNKFNDSPDQIRKICSKLKEQVFTKLMGLVPQDKINITFDLYVTSFGVSIINVQFPTEVDIKGKMYSFGYPTYVAGNWSPVLTTAQEAGPLAQRVYEQLCLLNIHI